MALRRVAIVVHGGAWAIPEGELADCNSGVHAAAQAGLDVLLHGGNAIDAVEAAIRVLEDAPVFDAGTGSVLNASGDVECDALLVDGDSLRSGAVAGLNNVKHPITVARRVMERTPHALFAGAGAREFARKHAPAEDLCQPDDLVTEAIKSEWRSRSRRDYGDSVASSFDNRAQMQPDSVTSASTSASSSSDEGADSLRRQEAHDTVGAVALDCDGRIAAGTSTGGISMKLPGRVGDSPLFGCGAYADSEVGGCSTTGHGEKIISALLAHRAVAGLGPTAATRAVLPTSASLEGDYVVLSGTDRTGELERTVFAGDGSNPADAAAQAAAAAAVFHMRDRLDGFGGLVLLSAGGGVGVAHTTKRMAWAAARATVDKATSF